MELNAIFQRKEAQFEPSPCVVEKTVELSASEFRDFQANMLADQPFIALNKDLMRVDGDGTTHALLVLGEGGGDGILVNADGHDYARCAAFVPGARQLLRAEELRAEQMASSSEPLTQADLDVAYARHILWLYDKADGVQADFSGKTLCELDFGRKNFYAACFTGATLDHCGLEQAIFENCDFSGAVLRGVEAQKAVFIGTDFTGAALDDCGFGDAWISNCKFDGTKMDCCDFDGVDLRWEDLSQAEITNCEGLEDLLQGTAMEMGG